MTDQIKFDDGEIWTDDQLGEFCVLDNIRGRLEGIQTILNQMRIRSGELFIENKDNEAKILRNFAYELNEKFYKDAQNELLVKHEEYYKKYDPNQE
jgi:hypothetical protein